MCRDPFNQSETYQVFPLNEQTPISSNIDNQALHELYLWGFAEAVRAGTGYVMWYVLLDSVRGLA